MWIVIAVCTVLIALEKYQATKNFGCLFVAIVTYFLLQLAIHNTPLGCVLNSKGSEDWLEILRAVVCGLFCLPYGILALKQKFWAAASVHCYIKIRALLKLRIRSEVDTLNSCIGWLVGKSDWC